MDKDNHKSHSQNYQKLLLMAILHFFSMYILMYSMVNAFQNVLPNINQFYMAGLMTMPMIIIEVSLMRSMYRHRRLNAIVIGISSFILAAFFFSIREQGAVSDKQFLKSMIPHHSGAILMCEQANLKDPEVKKLCREIIESQREEIEQMKAKLSELKEK